MQPGDLFATGSPPGVGPIKPGDEVTIDIERCAGTQFDPAVVAAFLRAERGGAIVPRQS
jgi:2-keto-4-pentenoate hydratase/2-oxohepta-3-ene-1,7-dioic acid hydratase in catechol pathway